MALKVSVIVCAHNEARYLSPCLHSLLAQSRLPDEIVVINNASTDETRAVALRVPSVLVVDEPRKGLVIARETGRRVASGDVLVYVDADCRAPIGWLALVEQRFLNDPRLLALSGPYRFYDWDWWGRALIRAYDLTLAPATQFLVKHVLRIGTVFYGAIVPFAGKRSSGLGALTLRLSFTARIRTLGAGCLRSGSRNICIRGRRCRDARRAGRQSVRLVAATLTWR
jgi:glycosyltransferase involved in cell wall biosynthesis